MFFNWIFSLGMIETFLVLLVLINILTFILYAIDKRNAQRKDRRIRESVLIFFSLMCGGIGALLGMCLMKHKTRKMKFRVIVAIGLIIAFIPLIHIAHGLTLDKIIRYVEIEFRSENWPAELNGYRIAFMTDFHTITDEEIRKAAERLNEKKIDLLLLGGDFSMENARYQGTVKEIARIDAADGTFGVDGNHDEYINLFYIMEQYGITPLDNSGIHIREGFYLAGVQDMWNRNPSINEAVSGAYADDFVLLISHHPDVSMRQSTSGIDLILSGHTHGGQITFLGYPIYLLRGSITEYGTHFAHGFTYSSDGTPVFTSRGIGAYYAWPRIFARPEVIIFTMYHE